MFLLSFHVLHCTAPLFFSWKESIIDQCKDSCIPLKWEDGLCIEVILHCQHGKRQAFDVDGFC